MGKFVQKPACLDMLNLDYNISVASARSCGNNIFIEGKRDEEYEG
jgi:hypothetical protein